MKRIIILTKQTKWKVAYGMGARTNFGPKQPTINVLMVFIIILWTMKLFTIASELPSDCSVSYCSSVLSALFSHPSSFNKVWAKNSWQQPWQGIDINTDIDIAGIRKKKLFKTKSLSSLSASLSLRLILESVEFESYSKWDFSLVSKYNRGLMLSNLCCSK